MEHTVIYKITNLVTGWEYVGQTCNFKRRMSEHFSTNCHNENLKNDLELYGKDLFSIDVLCSVLHDQHGINPTKLENYFIREANCVFPYGYNKCEARSSESVETRAKKRNSKLGKKQKPSTVEKRTGKNNCQYGKFGKEHPAYGNKCSETHKKHLSNLKKGKKRPEISGENSYWAKCSEAQREHFLNLSKEQKGKKRPEISGEKHPCAKYSNELVLRIQKLKSEGGKNV